MTTRSLRFRLDIRAEEYLHYYRGSAREVVATTEDGVRVRFPASALQPHVSHDGIHGWFEIEFDANHKLRRLRRLAG